MSAHAYAGPARRTAPDQPDGQPRLFALPGGAERLPLPEVAPQRPALASVPAPAATEPSAPATAAVGTLAPAAHDARAYGTHEARSPRTLDAELRLAWTALAAGAPAACILCGGRMEPRAHAPGGACTSCGTTLE